MFELSNEAAQKNFCIMKKFRFSLRDAISSNPNSSISYGSEFRDPSELAPLLQHHPCWPSFKRLLAEGSNWPLSEISDLQRSIDVNEAIKFGNHKGASNNEPLLRALILEDVTHGFILPLPLKKIRQIPGILIAPLNIINQNTIDEEGLIVPKDRLTHDQSFIFQGSNSSVNSQLNKSNLTPCTFSWTIKRLVNWTVAARRKHPNCRILASKIDFKSAYRRCHLHHASAVQSCSILPSDEIALLALRLTFGGAACAFEWSEISETI
jgi:hypothetical protein